MDNEIKTDTLKDNEEIKEDDNVNFEFSAQKIFQNRKKKLQTYIYSTYNNTQ